MLRDENYTINKIGIFNVLNGKLMIADISKWNKGKELFEYFGAVNIPFCEQI